MRHLLIAISLAVLAGCATHPVSNDDADVVEASKHTQPVAGGGRVIVKRDRGMMGGACSTGVYVNGEKVASLRPADLVTLYLPAGEHMIGAMNGGLCGGAVSEDSFVLSPNGTKTYRIEIGDAGRVTIQPTAF